MNKDETFQKNERSKKAKDVRSRQFEQNRGIATKSSESFRSEPSKELLEWRKKRDLQKKKKVTKKPFLPSGPAANKNIYKSKSETAHLPKSSKSMHSSLTSTKNSSPNSSKSSRSGSNPNTSITSGRVTRSQVKREKEQSASLQASKQVYVVDEKDLAWIPENEIDSLNLKVRRKSLHFSDVFSSAPRSPFVFRANLPGNSAKPREPPIIETSIEISPISIPSSVNRNLLGAFTMLADDTEILECEGRPVDKGGESSQTALNLQDSLAVTSAPLLAGMECDMLENQIDADVSGEIGIDQYSAFLSETADDLFSQRNRWQGTLLTLTDACDNIRVAIGHTDLLLTKKFEQYRGLIQDARDNPGNLDLETRCSDLQGFWDLILREVEDMQAKYSRLIRLAENGYQAVKSTHKLDRKPVRRQASKPKKGSTAVPRVTRSATATAGISLREQMMRGREQLKDKIQQPNVIIMTQQKNE